ncbi:GNAT family N-acetyltransferase [Frigidibacter sp. SD6-1]|uniref:GNAT family N-acetyltransferase n=1 Tax=Frigidibacter sp. SD6-1 TaxID=3032581 RepID=UPI0024DF5D2D|nr:GNAT family N-acetyltransferase [Frigidibacter sp. SD6-1]
MRRPHLQTGRLTLRPLEASDEAAVVAGLNDWDVTRWLAVVPFPYGPADFRTFLSIAEPGETWAIEDRTGFVGVIGNEGALGYWFARHAWGRGYATEAARAVLAAHFEEPEATMIESGYFDGNSRSANVLTKLGFRIAGYKIRRTVARPDEDTLSCRMELTRESWSAARPS